jgi:hypothetical protein
MHALFAALIVAAASQVAGNSPAGDRYPSQPAASPATEPAVSPQPGPSTQIVIAGETAQPTLSEPPAQQPAAPPAAASGAAGAAPAAAKNVPKTSDLLREWSRPPRTGQLAGVPVTLSEALRGATTRQQQTDRTMAYWDLAAKVTQYYLSRRDAMELAALRQGVTTPGPAWQAKAQALQNEQDLAQRAAEVAQLRFQQLLGRTGATSPPLPADLPHCGKYDTRYDEIFAARTEPAARQLNDLLPLKYAELRHQAGLVAEAYNWLEQVSKSRDPKSDGVGLLRAHELVSLRRRALVEAVRDYNLDIAAYTELAAPSDVGTERLVAMLIRVSNPDAGAAEPSGVEQASATEEADAASSSPQPTYGSRSRLVRRPAFWRLRNREHSILVDRLRRRLNRD